MTTQKNPGLIRAMLAGAVLGVFGLLNAPAIVAFLISYF